MSDLLSFDDLCDFVELELKKNPNRILGKIFKKEPYKSSLELVFPMIPRNKYFNATCASLLKNRQQYPPICKMDGCDSFVKYMNGKFNEFCGSECSTKTIANDPKVIEKKTKTNLKRYGHENPLSNQSIQEKVKQTNLERYGCIYPLGNGYIQQKRKQTNLERYGHENPLGNPDIRKKVKKTIIEKYNCENASSNSSIKEKRQKTNLKNYGHENPFGNSDIQEKIKKTNLERYGYESAVKNLEVKDKIKQTNMERYGSEYVLSDDAIREQIKQTNLERYGYENPLSNSDIQDKIRETNLEKYGATAFKQAHLTNIHILQNKLLFQETISKYRAVGIAELCNCDISTIYRYAQDYDITLPTFPNSYWESELADYLYALNISYELNTRKIIAPYELDFYLPDYNLAIELNGNYWHSDKFKDKNYHYDKWKLCQELDIQLWQIWDTDWETTKDIWKSRISIIISKAIKIAKKPIDNKNYNIQEAHANQARSFYDQNHIQGFTEATMHLKLAHDDAILAMMSFQLKSCETELIRFCSKMNHHDESHGAILLDHFTKQHPSTTIISFSDNMHPDDELHESLGFIKESEIEPDYTYTKGLNRYHKQEFSKPNIQQQFNIPDEEIATKTEYELMNELGYVRIWDAGKTKWILKP